jgi:lysozyme family protein
MTKGQLISRRRLALTATALIAGTALPQWTLAQTVLLDDWKQLAAMSNEAKDLGISVAQVTAPDSGTPKFQEIVPAIVDFIDDLEEPTATAVANAAPVAALKKRAAALLNTINSRERVPRQKSEAGPVDVLAWLGLVLPARAETPDPATRYERYRRSYAELFDTCVIRPERKASVAWYVDKLTSPKYRTAYEKLEDDVCIPWYFIGVIHALETSFNFNAHLHNGDPLERRTVHVPAGRPEKWLPPSDWQSSAKDALTFEKYTDHLDWNLERILFRLEGYNGFRSREQHGINTPYLWSFSNHYTSGKFVADNEWSATAVSEQCGAAVMIKAMVDRKLIQLIV